MKTFVIMFWVILVLPNQLQAQLATGWKAHDLNRPLPEVVSVSKSNGGSTVPSDAIVLFDGSDLSQWRAASGGDAKWKIVDGAMESVPKSGYVTTKQQFGDCQLHVEFATPVKVKGKGQGRGNSGVFLMGKFEVQVLDSFDNPTYADGSAGSIYGQHPPLVNVSRKPGQWQTYEIIFTRPRFSKDGSLESPARFTVIHNGVLIQNNVEAFGPTNWIRHKNYQSLKNAETGPVSLQDHGNPVRYRNIWIRDLEKQKPAPENPYPDGIELTDAQKEKLVGKYGRFPITLDSGKLFMKQAGQQLEMIPVSPTEFQFAKSAGTAKFELDGDGNVTGLEVALDAFGKPQKVSKEK